MNSCVQTLEKCSNELLDDQKKKKKFLRYAISHDFYVIKTYI